jgi:hypothetical protein
VLRERKRYTFLVATFSFAEDEMITPQWFVVQGFILFASKEQEKNTKKVSNG